MVTCLAVQSVDTLDVNENTCLVALDVTTMHKGLHYLPLPPLVMIQQFSVHADPLVPNPVQEAFHEMPALFSRVILNILQDGDDLDGGDLDIVALIAQLLIEGIDDL